MSALFLASFDFSGISSGYFIGNQEVFEGFNYLYILNF